MSKPNFFCNIEVLQYLLDLEQDGDFRDIDLTVDLLEIPYYLSFESDEGHWTITAYQRGEIYTLDPENSIERGKAVVDKLTREGQVQAEKAIAENMGAFLRSCRGLSRYIQQQNLEEVYQDFDPEQTGLLLYVENDDLKYKVVSGSERPELACKTLFGGTVTGRPYMEDFLERSARDMMSLEEKIEEAENGDMECMRELAAAYTDGDDEVEADPEQAVYWMRKMAEAGDAVGMFNLGLHYAKGYGVERDFEQAALWMERAAAAGDEDAPNVAIEYRKLANSVERAQAGDAQAQADLAEGLMRLGGSLNQAGAGKDYEESVMWAKKAVAQGNADGMWPLALAYHHGRGVKQDIDQAIVWYMKGAAQKNPACMHNLACEYLTGENIWKDQKKGFSLIKEAAEMGYGLAMRDLGRCYQFGNGCTGSMKKAIEWYEKAMEVLDDPELAQKTAIFKMLQDQEPDSDQEYAGEEDPYENVKLDGTQYEGRLDRCERLSTGSRLNYKIGKDKNDQEVVELFYLGGSVGYINSYLSQDIIKFLKKDKITIQAVVKSCIPKSKRGPRARTAEVYVKMNISAKMPESEEDKKKRLEAEAKKRAEEEKKKQEEKTAKIIALAQKEELYEYEINKWKRVCTSCESDRQNYVNGKLAEARERLQREAESRHTETTKRLEALLTVSQAQKAEAEKTLSGLGLFKFGEKKTLKDQIASLSKTISESDAGLVQSKQTLQEETAAIPQKIENMRAGFISEAETKYPMPKEPVKPAELIEKEKQDALNKLSEVQRAVLKLLRVRVRKVCTVEELMNVLPEAKDYTYQSLGSQIQILVNKGFLGKEYFRGTVYYSLKDEK